MERLREFDAAESFAQALANETGKWVAVIEIEGRKLADRYAVRAFTTRPSRRVLGLISWKEKEKVSADEG